MGVFFGCDCEGLLCRKRRYQMLDLPCFILTEAQGQMQASASLGFVTLNSTDVLNGFRKRH